MQNELTQTHQSPAPLVDVTVGASEATGTRVASDSGYEIGELIARGGMGDIFRSHDLGLDREIAVKVLQDRYPPNSIAARRFVEEARTTARLQHPGIPPVHQVGTLPDGRPFLAMKLVRGRTLADILREPDGTNLLAAFEGICQAVGYAHAHGIIHRDLKPANVMVGAFGEVQVMDWGLAKTIGRGSPQIDGEEAGEAPGEDREATQYGAVLGTPAYMPPEQATGEIASIDARSDVFGLGAILCVILTGSPPYLGESTAVVWQLARNADLAEAYARLETCRAESELVALCKRCLSAEQANRPADATAVAGEVARLRTAAEARARRAEIDRAATDVRAEEERKRHRLGTRLVVGIAVALALGAGLSTWLAARATVAEHETATQLAETATQERRARDAEAVANTKAKEVEASLKVIQERTKSALRASVTSASMLLLSRALNSDAPAQEDRSPLVRLTFEGLVNILSLAERDGGADQSIILGHVMLGLLHDVMKQTTGRDQEFRTADALIERLAAGPPRAEQQRELVGCFDSIGAWLMVRGKTAEGYEYYKKGLEPLRWLAQADPKSEEVRLTQNAKYYMLGKMAERLGRTADAIDYYQQSLKVFGDKRQHESKVASALLNSYWSLGTLYRQRRDFDKAIESFQNGESVGAAIPKPSKAEQAVLAVLRRDLTAARHAQRAVNDLSYLRTLSDEDQSQALVERLRAFTSRKDLPNLISTAELYDALATKNDRYAYDAACSWSLVSGLTTGSMQREEYARKAMTWLRKTRTGKGQPLASQAELAAHVREDTNLDPLRERDDYRKFVSGIQSASPAPVKGK